MIYLVSDIHGYIRLEWLKKELRNFQVKKSDFFIILGDAGIVWDNSDDVKNYYDSLPCETLFIDGNHENFDLLEQYNVTQLFGGSVHKITEKIYHLQRGEIYNIDGLKIFTFGGGFSAKKLTNSSPIYVWDREMPNQEEYKHGLDTIKRHNYQVDLVLTHVAPTSFALKMGIDLKVEEKELNDYLESINKELVYKKWFCGHHHKDFKYKKAQCIYEQIVKIGE